MPPHAAGFSQSNLHDINYGRYPILLPWELPARHVPALATYTPIAIPAAPLSPPRPTANKARIYMNPSVSN